MNEKLIMEWYEKYSVGIYRFSLAMLGSRHLAEDVLQETFVRVMKKPPVIVRAGKEQAWLYRIARNLCYDVFRKQKREQPLDSILDCEQMQAEIVENQASDLEFVDMLAGLSDVDKEIVSLRIIGELTHKEIARVMGMTVHATKKRYERAIQKLRMEFMEGNV